MTARRDVLPRKTVTVKTRFGGIPIKICELDGKVVTATPEYEDCRRIAEKKKMPLRTVLEEAKAAYAGMRKN